MDKYLAALSAFYSGISYSKDLFEFDNFFYSNYGVGKLESG